MSPLLSRECTQRRPVDLPMRGLPVASWHAGNSSLGLGLQGHSCSSACSIIPSGFRVAAPHQVQLRPTYPFPSQDLETISLFCQSVEPEVLFPPCLPLTTTWWTAPSSSSVLCTYQGASPSCLPTLSLIRSFP